MFLDFLFPPRCYICSRPGSYFHPHCFSYLDSLPFVPPSFSDQGRLSLFKYHGPIRRAITDLKYDFVSHLVPDFSSLVCHKLKTDFPNLLKYWKKFHYCFVPIPLHPSRQRFRGFNQSALLASRLASDLKLGYSQSLLRPRPTSPQAQLSRPERLKNLGQPFCLNSPSPLPQNIILFDDVYTTGATIRAAIMALPVSTSLFIFTLAS
ncbi:ComF family protein [Patescibacteria group bacterium]|nr:ComF family protein [Patescibacteria group bacterium]